MKMNKIAFAVISVLCVFTFFSCDLLTKPLLEQIGLGNVLQYAPDAESLGNADTTVLANAAGDISIAADPAASKAVLEALSAKVGSDENALDNLSPEQETNILSLTTATVLPIDKIVSVAAEAMNGSSSESTQNNEATQTQEVIQNMLDSIQFIDTRATEKILLAKASDPNLSSEDASTVLLATISVAISACKSSPMRDLTNNDSAVSDLLSSFDENDTNASTSAETLAENILDSLAESGEGDSAGISSLANAITVLRTLTSRTDIDVSPESLMGMFTGGMGQSSSSN